MNSQSPDFDTPDDYEEPRAPDVVDLEVIEDGVREVHPFTNISGIGQGVNFVDFAPKPLPSDAPEEIEEIVVVPKDSSAPEPVSSSVSVPTTELPMSESPASPALVPPTLPTGLEDLGVEPDDGKPNPSEPSK